MVTAVCAAALSGADVHAQTVDPTQAVKSAIDLRRAGKLEESEAELRKLLPAQNNNPEVLFNLGLAVAFQDRFKEAAGMLDRAQSFAPNDNDIRLARARVRYWDRDFEAAAKIIAPLSSAPAPDADELLLAAQIEMARGNLQPARALVRRHLAAAPRSAEGHIVSGDIEQEAGNRNTARTAYEQARTLGATDQVIGNRLDKTIDGPRVTVSITEAYSTFSRQKRKDWHEQNVSAAFRATETLTLTASVDTAQRFGLFDVSVFGGIIGRPSPGASGYLSLGATPDADFLPEHSVLTGGEIRMFRSETSGAATWLTVDGRYAKYSSGNVESIKSGLRQYLADLFYLSGQHIAAWDENGDYHNGWAAGAGLEDWHGFSASTGVSNTIEASNNVTATSRSYFLSLG